MQLAGSKELVSGVIKNDLCIGCGACVSLCPYFKSHNGKTVMLFQCSRDKGRCFAYCPRVEVDLDGISQYIYGRPYGTEAMGNYITIRSSRAGAAAGLKTFQTAGTVSSLMMFALGKGVIDSAVVTARDGVKGKPVVVTDASKIPGYAATGYSAAPVASGFNEAMNAGYKKIGIVGTPCQVNAVAQIRTNPMETENFTDPSGMVIGLFCTWALDTGAFLKILRDKTDIASIKRYDIPPPPAGVMKVQSGSGTVDIPLTEIRGAIPGSCSYCHDMTAEFADISVGVFEGREKLNILITRTRRGEELVQAAISAGFLEAETLGDKDISELAAASMNKKKRARARLALENKINSAEGISVLRMNGEILKQLETM